MRTTLLAALVTLTAAPALAQSGEPARYQLISVSGGFVRLDTVSGVMTFCRDEVDSFRCGPIPLDSAKAEIKPDTEAKPDMEAKPDAEMRPDEEMRPEAGDEPRSRIRREPRLREDSSVEDFDRAISMMERAMRGFMAMSQEKRRDCDL